MNIQQMQYFAEVCRQENVTKAAASLHMSQSTLSLSMKNLETETGLNLFRHVGRNIQLTADGQALFQEVEKMLKQFKRFEASVKEIAKRHNHLQLAVPSQIATIILPLLLGEFFQQHPEIQLEITEPAGGGIADLHNSDYEVVEALTTLGYSIVQAQTAVQSLPKNTPDDVEEKLRLALQSLA